MLCGDCSRNYFLGMLNFKITTFYLSMISNNLGESSNIFQKSVFEQLSIPILDTTEKCEIAGRIETLMEETLELKKHPVNL